MKPYGNLGILRAVIHLKRPSRDNKPIVWEQALLTPTGFCREPRGFGRLPAMPPDANPCSPKLPMQSQETAHAAARQTRQQFVTPDEYLSYELGKAVQELPPLYTRLLAGSLTMLVFGAIAWAHFSKVDEVAVAPGQLILSEQVRPVRALDGGIISEIAVEEGEQVKQGDVLITQDPALNQSEVTRLQQAAELVRQDIARLDAELNGDVTSGNLFQDQLLAARLQELETRRATAIAESNRQEAAIAEAQARLARLETNLESAYQFLDNAERRESSLRQLVGGAIPRFDYLEAVDRLTQAQDQVNSLQQDIESQQQTIRQTEAAYQGSQSAIEQVSTQYRSEILTQLNRRREELSNIEGQLAQAEVRSSSDVIRAPVSGRVYNIQVTRAEGTVAPGEELLSILPEGGDLVLEAQVLNRDIGFIAVGMRAKVKVTTFPFQEFGVIEGEVIHISPNATADEQLGLVYTTRVRLDRSAVPVRGTSVPLSPGMNATAEIVTRQKTVLTFLLEPITRRFDEAFSVR
jgi:HlyD family secretion protein